MSTTLDETARPVTDGSLSTGMTFGRYRIVRLLGKGGMGAVYEGFHLDLHKRVAIKTLRPEMALDTHARSRFVREGRAAARLQHPHVVDVTDVGEHDGVAFLVMEYLDGEDLAHVIAREGPLSEARTAEFLLPVCAAIEAAHGVGIVHRDLKPENIFLSRDGFGEVQPKVVDFGISKVATGPNDLALTASAALLGTAYYMSPEQAVSAKNADARSDQFSLGVILYQCVTGRRPFNGESLFPILYAISEGRFDPPCKVRPDLSPDFETIILRAMSVSPEARFPSVGALAHALLAFADVRLRQSWERRLGSIPPPTVIASSERERAAIVAAAPPLLDTLAASPREIDRRSTTAATETRRYSTMGLAIAAGVLFGLGAWSLRPQHPSPSAHVPPAVASAGVDHVAPPSASANVTGNRVSSVPATAATPTPQAITDAGVTVQTPPAVSSPRSVPLPAGPHPRAHHPHGSGCRELDNGAFDCSGEGQ